jgi:hypothetical protein
MKKVIYVVGGLGSQMMAYSLYLAMRKRNQNVSCDFSWYDSNHCHNGAELNKLFGIDETRITGISSYFLFRSPLHLRIISKICTIANIVKYHNASDLKYNYDETVFDNTKTFALIVYYQCWTSWRYFAGVENEIKDVFIFPEINDPNLEEIESNIRNSNSVSIHVRRGDYNNSDSLKNLTPLQYFEDAINVIRRKVDNPKFFVFSDDIEWCKNNFTSKDIIFVSKYNYSNYIDMQLMSLCKHNILSNSSFSGWAAFLNRNNEKIVISPEVWSNYETGVELKDMNMPEWIKIKNY